MAGDYYNSKQENPALRASSQPGLFRQLENAISGFISDVGKAVGFGIPNQDRGSAARIPDVLLINAQNTPPAKSDYWGPDNPEIAYSHQNNKGPDFRFVGIAEWQPIKQASHQGGNSKPPFMFTPMLARHSAALKERFSSFAELVRGRSEMVRVGTFTQIGVQGKKILQDTQMTQEGSGASSGSGSGGSGSGGGGGTSGGYHGGGRIAL